ncbi:MAG: MMPL family transporter [Desulfuromonadaceae bacterium]|nr:MMPL family transporter [Desulfuromonadaceae bacterium]
MQENIAAMLPDSGRVAATFQLLEKAPFARKVVISIEGNEETSQAALIDAVDRLAEALDPALFPVVVSGPDFRSQQSLLPWLVSILPSLVTEQELQVLRRELDREEISFRLRESYRQLLGPEGWALKGIIRQDPLGLHRLLFQKLRLLNLVPQARLVDGHFLSQDGKSALIAAKTPIAMTDSAGSEKLLNAFLQARKVLPESIQGTLVSGHRYAVANARAIRGDLWLILSCSLLALAAIFIIFLRRPQAIFVFLVPLSVVCLAAVAVGAVYREVSAVTIGFGAVLLGISVDFGLHVYFALGSGKEDAATLVGNVARPVVFGGLTTVSAFAVLLSSDLPGQRQLALFSITGITAALLLALIVLPHLLPLGKENSIPDRQKSDGGGRFLVIALWAGLLILAGWQVPKVTVDGDLAGMGMIPEELAADEARLRHTWGDVRGRAMIWSLGSDLEEALAVSHRLYQQLAAEVASPDLVALAPLLPPLAVQENNQRRWRRFWAGGEGDRILSTLARESAALGFSSQAFAPFIDGLGRAAPLATVDGFRSVGLAEIVDALLVSFPDGRCGALTLIPETSAHLAAAERVLMGFPEARLVSQGRFRTAIGDAIQEDFVRFIAIAGFVVFVLVSLLFRRPGRILAALTPVVTGLVVMLGIMGFFAWPLNLFNIIAAILVIGLGVDYGIFMVCRQSQGTACGTERAVLVSGLTTLAGFGALVLARHPALHSIGVTVLLGIGAAIPAALYVIPALYGKRTS